MGSQYLAYSVRFIYISRILSEHTHPLFPSFILNFKRLAYRTTWIEFPEVETTMRVIGAPPSGTRPDGRPIYTLPVIVDPTVNPASPIIISNANNIAEYLDAAYPARPVFPEGSRAVQTLFVHYIQEVFIKPLLPILVPVSHRRLPERTQSHFRTSGGSSSNEAERPHAMPAGPQREHAWRAVQEQFDFLHIILSKNVGDGDGIVTMGSVGFSCYVEVSKC